MRAALKRFGRPGRSLFSRWRRRTPVVVVAIMMCVLAFSGCASIPTDGSVGVFTFSSPPLQQSSPAAKPQDPPENSSASAVLSGFIDAAVASLNDGFQVARKYLSPNVATTWNGSARTLVYSDQFQIAQGDAPDVYTVSVKVLAEVDGNGVMVHPPAGASETLQYKMTRSAGQVRIDSLPDGILIDQSSFNSLYQAKNLYFYDPALQYLVPDARWFPSQKSGVQGTSIATLIVKALLAGPAPYLVGAVSTLFPPMTSLVRDSVPIVNGTANIELTPEPIINAPPDILARMQEQLRVSLQYGVNVSTVRMLVNQNPVVPSTGRPRDVGVPVQDPQVADRMIGVSREGLVWVEGDKVSPVDGVSVAGVAPRSPAVSSDAGGPVAFLDAEGTSLYTAAPGAETLKRFSADSRLTQPSFEANSRRVWAAATDGSGRVFVSWAQERTPPHILTVDWLKGYTVNSLRISRDGTRVLAVATKDGVSMTWVSGILRGGSSGDAPWALNNPTVLYTGDGAQEGYWASETGAVVFQADSGAVRPVEVSFDAAPVGPTVVPGLQKLAVGNGPAMAYAQTLSGAIYKRTDNTWSLAPFDKVFDLAYPG